jgi:hypothetical protein
MRSSLEELMRQADPAELYEMPPVTGDRDDPLYASILSRRGTNMSDPTTDQIGELQRESQRRRWTPAIAFAAAFVVLIVAIGLMSLLRSESPPTADEQPVATPTSVPVTSVTETTIPSTSAAIEISWTRVPDQPAFENAAISQASPLIEGGPGLVAVGGSAVFVSADGIAWERVDLPWENVGWVGQAYGVASGPDGTLVAVGNDGRDAAIWVSADGLSWSRVSSDVLGGPDFQNILRVVAGGPGFVAVGQDGSNAGLWVSADGYDWTKVEDDDLLAGSEINVSISDVEVGGPGLIAVGSAGLWDGDGVTGAAWVSRDGYRWDRLPNGTFAAETGTTGLGSVTVDPATGRLVAFGSEMWTSSDGHHWVVTERDLPSGGPVAGAEVAWHGQDAVAAGYDARYPSWLGTPWVSGDGGMSWTQVEPDGSVFDTSYDRTVSVTWFSGRWVVAGEDAEGGVIWIGTPEG